MKIVSWNCCGKFREKFPHMQKLNADIYVIQECENPAKHPIPFSRFLSNYIWCGENANKGLCVFAKSDIKLEQNDWPTFCLRHFASIRINDNFDLLGVWACRPYIEEYYIYQCINIERYNDRTIIIGDFNSNPIWDKQHGSRNHSAVAQQLEEINITSAYHHTTGESPGCETRNTFYLYRHDNKKYHIDYCFLNPSLIKEFQVLDNPCWLQLSDHMPLEITVQPPL